MNGDPGNDLMFGDAGIDTMNGGSGFDTMRGGTEADLMHGDPDGDTMFGDSGADRIFGDGGADVIRGGIDADYVEGNDDGDTISGDAAADEIYGNAGNDAIRGNAGDDDVEGNDGDDTIGGDSGHDDILGGSGGGGAADGSDTITGNSGHDVIAGDNAALSRPGGTEPDGSVRRHVFLWDVGEDIGAADTISGDEGNDDIWGQAGGDTLHGNTGDDYLEGNAGDDVMFGDQAQDDLIGGTTQGGGATADGADEIHGGDSHDLIAGDNASISRGEWLRESFWVDVQDVVRRDVTLFDIATVEEDAPVGSAGGDRIFGDGGYDVVYGQGGDDEAHGGDGDDYVEGNAGGDMLDGDGGADDVMGGSPVAGRLDGGDTIHGGDSFDVIAGDNAVFTRPRDDNGLWIADTFAADAADVMRRDVTLLEVGQVAGGDDQLHGDGAFDRIFAQYGADLVHGGDGDDYAEGNEGADELHGDAGQDDLAGGGSAADGVIDADRRGDGLGDAADTIHGEDAGDVIAGDNARILRATPWATDPNTGDVVRDVLLFDVGQTDSGGADTAFGGGGHDLVFGQGNGPGVDDDGDGRVDEDPADGIDNDRDGRENPASNRGYDCADGRGDDADPDCLAHIDEDGRGDELHGGDGYDVIEGNHGSDLLFGDDGEDDVLGGSSAGDGHIGGGVAPTNLPDGHDVIRAGGEDDVVLADNGTIARGATWTMLTGVGGFDLPARVTTMATTPESVGAYGHDWVSGDDGHDDLYGQLGRDYLEGNTGEDAIVGDLGLITNNLLGDGLNDPAQFDRGIASRQPFLSAVVDRRGSLYRLVELYSFLTGQNGGEADVARGGEGHDSIHMGPGDDLASGGNGPDAVFGGDDADTLWGSGDDDHLYGGYGDDYLDVEPRPQMNSAPSDLPSWFEIGVGSYLGVDIVHGGWDRDALQANVGGPGPQPGDRLIDWVGAYDVFYVCPGAYGEGYITRANSPSVEEFLRALSSDDGALAPRTAGSSGYRELAYVLPNESRYNASPPHPDHPGHFTCGLS
jgi:Ca2+-binding RTX toxin-like protein